MNAGKVISFLFKSVSVGLAAAFVILFFRPDLIHGAPVVEFRQTSKAVSDTLAQANVPESRPFSYASAVQMAAPAVVNIYTTKLVATRSSPFAEDPFSQRFLGDVQAPRKRLESSLGSGVIVSSKGYVLTNNHVIEGAAEIQVALSDGRTSEARVVGSDRETDVAVLKIDLTQLPSIIIGESDALRVGDIVLAIGNPFGVGQTVTQGIVSAMGRNHLGINTFENFIQTDAAINPGNSGGALINAEGQLIGVNTAIFSRSGGSQGIGFAIPLSLAKIVMKQIIEHGHAIRGWLGIEVQAITPPLAESFGLPDTRGVLISAVLHDGPADESGLKPGDIVSKVDDKIVDDPVTLMNSVALLAPGTSVKLQALRNGKAATLTAVISERPAPPPVADDVQNMQEQELPQDAR